MFISVACVSIALQWPKEMSKFETQLILRQLDDFHMKFTRTFRSYILYHRVCGLWILLFLVASRNDANVVHISQGCRAIIGVNVMNACRVRQNGHREVIADKWLILQQFSRMLSTASGRASLLDTLCQPVELINGWKVFRMK